MPTYIYCILLVSALTASCPAYLSEITHSQYRQLFLSLTSVFFTLGIFIISVLNVLMTYKNSGLCLTVCFIILIILTAFIVPESPHWLAVIKLDLNSAKRNLKLLNPNDTVSYTLRLLLCLLIIFMIPLSTYYTFHNVNLVLLIVDV